MSGTRRSTASTWLPIVILVVHVLLGVLYSVVTPLWESFDEWGHYPYVEYIAEEHRLPQERLTENNDETKQPPLYYILGALATFWIDTSDDLRLPENEYSVHRGGQGGVSFYLHLEDEGFPYRGTVLAAHVTRLVSVLLSAVAVWATYLTTRTLFPNRLELALAAMSVAAFWPQLLFLGSVINNDVMVTASSSFLLFFLVRLLVQTPRLLDLLGLGLSLGASLLSKRNGLALLPLVVLGLVIVAIEQKQGRKTVLMLMGGTLLVALGIGLASSWWFGGLKETYWGPFKQVFYTFLNPKDWWRLHWGRLPGGLTFCLATFFASFGHLLLGAEVWIYRVVAAVCLTAGLGLFTFFGRKQRDRLTKIGVAILALHLVSVVAAPAYRTLVAQGETTGPTIIGSIQPGSPLLFSENVFLFQGRFVLPAISSFSILLSLGLSSLVPKHFQMTLLTGVGLILLAFSIVAPFRYIRPAYAKPKLLRPSQMEDLEHPLHLRFGESIELVGYETKVEEVMSGSPVPVTLYWRCLEEMEQNYALTVEVLGPKAQVYGKIRLHPGQGNFPTSLWEAGDSFRETYQVPVDHEVPTPSRAYFKVSFSTGESRQDYVAAFDAQGERVNAAFGQFIVRGKHEYQVEHSTYYRFGEKIALVGYEIEHPLEPKDELKITFYWKAVGRTEKDYTVFVHLVDRDGHLVTQEDGEPKDGLSPTSIWSEGEIVEDQRRVALPPSMGTGSYRVRMGLYDRDTMERLPAFDVEGSRLLHDIVELEEIEVDRGSAEGD